MHIGFLNPQGNFDRNDSHWTEHPDFGGQLVYVKNVAIAMEKHGHTVDILTRQIIDPDWPEFSNPFDSYPDAPNLRIIRLPAGPINFLRKELLWPHLISDWVPNILQFYEGDGDFPDVMTTHYGDGGVSGVLIEEATGIPFTFTAHSLGALKMDKLDVTPDNLKEMDDYFHFGRRLVAERLSMNRSAVNVTNTKEQERFDQYRHPAYHGAVDVNNDARFATIPPGVDPSLFGAQANSQNEDDIYQLIQSHLARDISENRRDLPAIVAASRLDPKKNVVGLVRAFAQNKTLQQHANLVLFTRGQDDPLHEQVQNEIAEDQVLTPIRELVNDHELWGKISAFSIPDQPALAAAYRFFAQRRSVFALVSHHEPFGIAPLEAMVAGLPVVVTQNGGLIESLRDGDQEFGILVDPDDPNDIAQGLEHIISDSDLWHHLEACGRKHVLKHYTWESTAVDYLNLLEDILSSPKSKKEVDLLPIHPYFQDPSPDNDVSLQELRELYFRD
ncbi:MAG: glycosyltransferase [Elainellaceae cyanobacterium]